MQGHKKDDKLAEKEVGGETVRTFLTIEGRGGGISPVSHNRGQGVSVQPHSTEGPGEESVRCQRGGEQQYVQRR